MEYTEKVERLEKILQQIEHTAMPLEQTLALYDEAQQLLEQCRAFLSGAEKKIRKLEDDGSLSDFPDMEG